MEAKNIFLAIKALPVQITNIFNQKILKNSIILTLPEAKQDTSMSGNIQDEPNLQVSGIVIEIEDPILKQESKAFNEEKEIENEEVYYLPTNPKIIKETESSPHSSLSSEDLREAREIFWT